MSDILSSGSKDNRAEFGADGSDFYDPITKRKFGFNQVASLGSDLDGMRAKYMSSEAVNTAWKDAFRAWKIRGQDEGDMMVQVMIYLILNGTSPEMVSQSVPFKGKEYPLSTLINICTRSEGGTLRKFASTQSAFAVFILETNPELAAKACKQWNLPRSASRFAADFLLQSDEITYEHPQYENLMRSKLAHLVGSDHGRHEALKTPIKVQQPSEVSRSNGSSSYGRRL